MMIRSTLTCAALAGAMAMGVLGCQSEDNMSRRDTMNSPGSDTMTKGQPVKDAARDASMHPHGGTMNKPGSNTNTGGDPMLEPKSKGDPMRSE
ncbi:MAG TPA: hypothetical protein VGB55_13940 [Tepidisphaeraceae bacterium]|jgi:hypothetical protein